MKICPQCGYKDNPIWRSSRFEINADYCRFDERPEWLINKSFPFEDEHGNIYYRRGTGGLYLYRVPKEDFKVPRERKKH